MATYVLTTQTNVITATATVPEEALTSFQVNIVNQFDDEAPGSYTADSSLYSASVTVARINSVDPSIVNTLLID